MATKKIAVYSLSDLKNTTDDALPNYLTSIKFNQAHFLTDVRLALGYGAVLVAAITFYADYKLGWDKTQAATFWAVLIYFILNGVLTFWIWGVEKGKVFVGEIHRPPRGVTSLSVASSVTKHIPVYNLTVCYQHANEASQKFELSSPFTRWFDADGFFVAKPFQQWLATEVPFIGEVDTQNKLDESSSVSQENEASQTIASSESKTSDTPSSTASSGQIPGSTKPRKVRKG